MLKWHQELVRRKWTYTQPRLGGRPPIPAELEAVIRRRATEHPAWGSSKRHGAVRTVGYDVGRSTVRDGLTRKHVPPAPARTKQGSSGRTCLGHSKDQILACNCCTVATVRLQPRSVRFGIELGSRRVHRAGCTAEPTAAWVTQQARQLSWELQEHGLSARLLIRDRDTKFPVSCDTVVEAEGITIIQTPYQAPKANAFAERWIRTVRAAWLDRLLMVREAHLRRVLREYIAYYNQARPQQGSGQRCPGSGAHRPANGPVRCRDVLGGIIHETTTERPRSADAAVDKVSAQYRVIFSQRAAFGELDAAELFPLLVFKGQVEKANDLIVARRQKNRGMPWSAPTSDALAALRTSMLNGGWDRYWQQCEVLPLLVS